MAKIVRELDFGDSSDRTELVMRRCAVVTAQPSVKGDAYAGSSQPWPEQIYQVLKAAKVRQMSYVPDAGHTKLINLFIADPGITTNVLTTEEEGIAIAAGAWLGGQRSVVKFTPSL